MLEKLMSLLLALYPPEMEQGPSGGHTEEASNQEEAKVAQDKHILLVCNNSNKPINKTRCSYVQHINASPSVII
jgi:hypothetical protein